MLTMLASASGATAAMSFLTERFWPDWVLVPSKQKAMIHLVGSILIGVIAYALATYVPAAAFDAVAPFLQIAAAIAIPWIMNQIAHTADPEASPERKADKMIEAVTPDVDESVMREKLG